MGRRQLGHQEGKNPQPRVFCWTVGWDVAAVPATSGRAWLFERGTQTSWRCRNRWSRWSWPSPGKSPTPVSHCQRPNTTRKGRFREGHAGPRKPFGDSIHVTGIYFEIPHCLFPSTIWQENNKNLYIFMQHKIVHGTFKSAWKTGFVMLTKADGIWYSSRLLWRDLF